ncbi:MAG: glycosyltransferase family 2 protein [Alloprevotella sp.]|nr:glycosyltransferase family 2 protein [Alloprevotella sp.]
MKPKVSILIAAYNAAPFLLQCLGSLLRQTEPAFEAICIDDCSTDETLALLREYAARDSRIRVLQTPRNSGQGAARNLGLSEARGELTMMLDADDWLADDAIELIWRAYTEAAEADTVALRLVRDYGGRQESDDSYEHLLQTHVDSPAPTLSGKEACALSIDWRLHGYNAVRTSLHRRLPYDTCVRTYADDNTCRLHYLHSRRVALSHAVYYYRQHDQSATHRLSPNRFDFLEANDSLRQQLTQASADGDTLRRCERYVWGNYIGLLRLYLTDGGAFSPQERSQIYLRLQRAHANIRPLRLRWPMRPSLLYLPSFSLLLRWQRFLLQKRGK